MQPDLSTDTISTEPHIPKTEPDITETSTSTDLDKTMSCTVCSTWGKYKCPTCRALFCSVVCGKTHKQTHANDPPNAPAVTNPPNASTPPNSSTPTTSTPTHRFSVLEDPRMGRLFLKYPDLEDQLAVIEKAYRPPPIEERIRTGWTTETGKERGMAALRKARGAHPGVAEYSELVTMLMAGVDEVVPAPRGEQDEIRRLMALGK